MSNICVVFSTHGYQKHENHERPWKKESRIELQLALLVVSPRRSRGFQRRSQTLGELGWGT